MTRKWYPVIDILSCIECGACIHNCPNSVYDEKQSTMPLVIRPENCKEHCHKCGNECSVGAITYVGDDSGWIPPVLREKGGIPDLSTGCGCCCGGFNG
ncbi:MAG: ferredoxin family protein [Ruminococcus flavefaciens]|nr:ferredoxin family protein [Ruminococcus flavefaciens]MCM1058769.1 ferredoxin family protein [Eubacterium sp.]